MIDGIYLNSAWYSTNVLKIEFVYFIQEIMRLVAKLYKYFMKQMEIIDYARVRTAKEDQSSVTYP